MTISFDRTAIVTVNRTCGNFADGIMCRVHDSTDHETEAAITEGALGEVSDDIEDLVERVSVLVRIATSAACGNAVHHAAFLELYPELYP